MITTHFATGSFIASTHNCQRFMFGCPEAIPGVLKLLTVRSNHIGNSIRLTYPMRESVQPELRLSGQPVFNLIQFLAIHYIRQFQSVLVQFHPFFFDISRRPPLKLRYSSRPEGCPHKFGRSARVVVFCQFFILSNLITGVTKRHLRSFAKFLKF